MTAPVLATATSHASWTERSLCALDTLATAVGTVAPHADEAERDDKQL